MGVSRCKQRRCATGNSRSMQAALSITGGTISSWMHALRMRPFWHLVPGPITLSGTVGGTAERHILDLNATGPGGTRASVTGGLDPALTALDLNVEGSTELALANAFIEPRSLQGPLGFNLAIKGKPALSSLSGRIVASGARLVAPALGLILENVDLTTDLANGRAQVNADARLSTGGTLTVSGPISLDAPNTADLGITLNRLILRDPELYETVVSGQLAIKGPLTGGARISGGIELGKTELRIPSTGISSVAEIPDITHIGGKPQQGARPAEKPD